MRKRDGKTKSAPRVKHFLICNSIMVRRAGLEPARPNGQEILSLSCLPIPPSAHIFNKHGGTYGSRTHLKGFADLHVTVPSTRHPVYYIRGENRKEATTSSIFVVQTGVMFIIVAYSTQNSVRSALLKENIPLKVIDAIRPIEQQSYRSCQVTDDYGSQTTLSWSQQSS